MPHVLFPLIVVVSCLLDAIVSSLALFATFGEGAGAPPPVISLRRAFRASLATTLFFIAKGALLATWGMKEFGWIHLAYIDLVVLTPALGAALLIADRVRFGGLAWRRLTTPVRVAAVASLALILVGVDATWIEPFRLQVETARITVNPRRTGKDIIRIGVLTDLQTSGVTDYERSAVDRLMAEKPDVILLPGDVFQGSREEFEATKLELQALLGRLSAPGVFTWYSAIRRAKGAR